MIQPTLLDNDPSRAENAAINITSKITRLQDKCVECGKVAKELFSTTVENDNGDEVKTVILECYHTTVYIIPKATPFHNFVTAEHRNNGCTHEWDKNKCSICDAFRLFPFQVEGARFIETALSTGRGAGLFDEMGLGKTVQPLAYLHYHPEMFPVLFIVKSGVKYQFFKEIIRFLGLEYFSQVISTGKDPIIPGLKTYIISYDLLRRFDREKLLSVGFQVCILDEVQQIKNSDSTRTKEVRRIVSEIPHVIPCSGTPWKNRGSEFFNALNMLSPAKFPSEQGFRDRWVDYYWNGDAAKEGGIRNPDKFKEYISDIAIRRERVDVMKELPVISRNMLFTQLEGQDAKTYDAEVSEFVRFYNEEVVGGGGEEGIGLQQNMLARLARMRHITGLAKIPTTVNFVVDHIGETGRKIVIFVHHRDVGELITRELQKTFPSIPILKLTADVNAEGRFDLQERFNSLDCCIMIASTLAAGEGLNLQTCSDCILHERQWNPANEEQVEGRFIRIGQVATSVNATYPTAEGTVDEFLARLIEEKRSAFHAAMNNGQAPMWSQGDIISELAKRIVGEANKLQKAASF